MDYIYSFLVNTGLIEATSQSGIDSILTYFFHCFISLFVMIDPFAVIPLYLLLMQRLTPQELKRTRRKAFTVATLILITFALTGLAVLEFFQISVAALRIAGGFLLLKFTLEQISSADTKEPIETNNPKNDFSVVPFAIPMLAGPGSISLIVVESSFVEHYTDMIVLILSVFTAMGVSYLILRSSQKVFKLIGDTGLMVFTKIMILLIAAISIQYILTGLKDFLPSLGH